MEYNIERSSSVSMFKKERKLDDGKIVWDSVVKLRKKNPGQCSKFPKNSTGIRNNWIKEFSNMLSDKASAYVLETMCSERTSRQEEIAQTLLNRFNNFLEQEASMTEPKTLTHKAMVMMADKLSLWLDKNVKVSKNVGVRLRQMEEEEKKKRLMEEMQRLEQERRDKEEEKKRKMAEEMVKKLAEPKSSHDVMKPPPETEPEVRTPEPETGDDKVQEKGDEPPSEGQQDDQLAQEQEPQPSPPATESTDGEKTEGPLEDQNELGGTQQTLEGSQDEEEAGAVEGKMDEIGDSEGDVDNANKQEAENEVPSDNTVNANEGLDENVTGIVEPSSNEDTIKIQSDESVEPDVPDDSPVRKILGVEDQQSVEGTDDTIDGDHPAPDVADTPSETLKETYSSTEMPESLEYGSIPPSSDSEFSDRDEMSIEPSKDSDTLVEELLGSAVDEQDTDMVDHQDDITGKSVDDKTNMVLSKLAEMIAATREEPSPLQEAIKDIMEKELEERLGDKDVEAIDEIAGKVGTWMDKMIERAGEEYGERRFPSRVQSVPPRAVGLPKVSSGAPHMPGLAQVSHSPAALPQAPLPAAVSPESLAESSFATARSPSPQPPVSQKPKGPIFALRKVDTKNIFNVAGVSHTKAKRKIREARGQSTSSRRVSQESLDLGEWAEWAGLVSDVSQNWAKWIEDVAQGKERPDKNTDNRLSADVKEWKNISKEIQREGEVWMKKVVKKQNKMKSDPTPNAKPVSV